MQRQKDQYGESFAHEVNGKAFFAMGADYIPEEHLLGRRSEEKTRKLLEDCKLANFNVIRVWGGGFQMCIRDRDKAVYKVDKVALVNCEIF